jgi:hypothetical protein
MKIDNYLSTDLPWIPIYDIVWLNVKGKYVKGPDIPIGRYVFFDKLSSTYIETTQVSTPTQTPTTTTSPTTTPSPTPTPTPTPDIMSISAVIIVIIVIGVVVLFLLKKRK